MKMSLRQIGYSIVCNIALVSMAFAGTSGQPPAGDQGASASEPTSFALIMLCAIPGVFLIHRALRSNGAED